MHSIHNHFLFLVLLLTTGIIFVPSTSATIDEEGAKNILSQWEQNFLFMCQIYKNHDEIDELEQWDLDQCKKLWKKYYHEDFIAPIIISTVNQIAYQFVVCDGIIYPEGTDCEEPENNIEELIDHEKLQEELEEKDEKEHKEWAKENNNNNNNDKDDDDD
jgi:hypothetical protein